MYLSKQSYNIEESGKDVLRIDHNDVITQAKVEKWP